MHVAKRSAKVVNDRPPVPAGFSQASSVRHLDVALKPVSRPELGEIRLDDSVFAIGRIEQPFASYGSDIVKSLSRRHARILQIDGRVCLEDLESRNGTTVNGVKVERAHRTLSDGDEICFGGLLSYRVEISPRAAPEEILTLTLTPQSSDSGLDTIVIAKFPFFVGKSDAAFAYYREKGGHSRELSFLSRRHACVYQKGNEVYVEDLGSGNGTFVAGVRLQDSAVALRDGVVVAFGGNHFVYAVSITPQSTVQPSQNGAPTLQVKREPRPPPMTEGTRFVAAPTSFLQIFLDAYVPKVDVGPGGSAVPASVAPAPAVRRPPRGRVMLLLSELASLLASGEPDSAPRRWWAAAGAGVLGVLALTAYIWSSSERDLNNAVARGDYARATALASRLLEKRPDDYELKALTTEAALKANVPAWLLKIRARDFDGASGVLANMSGIGMRDADLRTLIDELQWLGNLERLVSARGGPEASIRIYADEDSVEHIVARWNDDTGEHQRAMARIASHVPQFGDWYGEALTHLRRLQSESTVYLPVIRRVKATIATELERDNSEALTPILKETAERYPGLGGLDNVRQDLALYIEIRQKARARKSERLFAVLQEAHFRTPPFIESFRALKESGQLPPADLLEQYEAATIAWKDGKPSESLAELERITAGPWGEAATEELKRRRDVMARYAAVQRSRNTDGFVDELLALRESLDADEDVYFVRATAADLNEHKAGVIAHAQDALNRARTLWQAYRSDGAIDASQRIETSISDRFRVSARLLEEASRYARRGFLLYSQVDPAGAAQWAAICNEIEFEEHDQRSKLRYLSNVVEPGLLKAKLDLLGDPNE